MMTQESAPKEGTGLAAAKSKPNRPRSPLAKRRKRMAPPVGVTASEGNLEPEIPLELSERSDGCPVNLLKLEVRVADDLQDWASHVKDLFKLRATFADLGRHLLGLMSSMPSPLGNFVRSHCLAAQPPTAKGSRAEEAHGDLLPIAVWRISTQIGTVNDNNIDWVKAVICCLNFHYCAGWSKPICVPIRDALSNLQEQAINRLAATIDSNIMTADQLSTLGECDKLLSSKKYDYAGVHGGPAV